MNNPLSHYWISSSHNTSVWVHTSSWTAHLVTVIHEVDHPVGWASLKPLGRCSCSCFASLCSYSRSLGCDSMSLCSYFASSWHVVGFCLICVFCRFMSLCSCSASLSSVFYSPLFFLSHCPHLCPLHFPYYIYSLSFLSSTPSIPSPKQSVTVMLLKRTQCVSLNQTDELGAE